MKQKLITLFLVLVASVGTMFASVQIGDLYYNLDDENKTAEVTSSIDNYSGLTSIDIPASVEYEDETYSVTGIEHHAFEGCSGLTSVTIPNSVASIGDYAFCECSGLISIEIPNSVTSIGEWLFYGCSSLTSIEIPNSVTSIGDFAFYGCSSLISIEIPNSVTSIGEWAFSECTSLTSVTIPNSVTSIGDNAFYNVLNIVYSGTSAGSPWGAKHINCFVEGWFLYTDITKTTLLECSTSATGEITIPNGVTSIEFLAFVGCTGLTSVTIPNSVTSIKTRAFEGCSSLVSIEIPNSVNRIGYHAFAGCSSLASIEIPNSVRTADFDNLFDGYYGDAGLCLALFDNDNSLTEPVYNSHTFFYLPKYYEGEYTIPQGIEIVAEAIAGCENLTAIHILEGVRIINGDNFYGCPNLNEITFPNSITRIVNGDDGCAFSGSGYYNNEKNWTTENGIKSLYIGNCLIEVNDFGTQTHWNIKEGTTVLADWITRRANNREQINSVTLPESLITIGDLAFTDIHPKSVIIPDNVRYVGEGNFWSDSIVSITVGDGVEEIGPEAFSADNLKTIVLGSGIRRIGPAFIHRCSRLSTIICRALEVPELFTFTSGYSEFTPMSASDFDEDFNGVSRKAHLYVPAEVIQDYEVHPVWGQFNVMAIQNATPTNVDQVTIFETTETSVSVAWPAVAGAVIYEVVVKDLSGNIICTLVLNSNFQLLSIVFNAPQRDKSTEQKQSNGLSFTITGLEENTTYDLTITAKNANDDILDTQEISFTTASDSPVIDQIESTSIQGENRGRLILHNGQILILRGDKVYTVDGKVLEQ